MTKGRILFEHRCMFDNKQSKESIIFSEAELTACAVHSRDIKNDLLDRNVCGVGLEPCGIFLLFFIKTACCLLPKVSLLTKAESYSTCWTVGNITLLFKCVSADTWSSDYHPVIITCFYVWRLWILLVYHLDSFAKKNSYLPLVLLNATAECESRGDRVW